VFVQPFPQFMKKLTAKDVISYLETKVAKYAVPKFVKIVDDLPRTAVEKVDKKLLRQIAVEEFSRSKRKLATKSK